MAAKKLTPSQRFEKMDMARDKKMGIKELSKADLKMDKPKAKKK